MCLLVYMYMCILYITLGTVVCVAKLDTNVEFYFIFSHLTKYNSSNMLFDNFYCYIVGISGIAILGSYIEQYTILASGAVARCNS